LSAVKLTEH